MTTLSLKATEHGSYPITATFLDTDATPFTPKTLKWSLLDTEGAIINSRDKVVITVPFGVTETIILEGADLDYPGGAIPGVRIFYIEGTYDASYGNDQEFRAECKFKIENLIGYDNA